MTQIVAVDIGGTHARFAIAHLDGGRVLRLTDETVLKAAEFASLQTAWEAFAARLGRPLPREAGIAVACPPHGEVLPLAWDLARRISRTWLFQGERIWCQNSKPLGIWGYPRVFVPNYHHHYCLIFRHDRAQEADR